MANRADAERAVAAAQSARASIARLSVGTGAALHSIADVIARRCEEPAKLVTLEQESRIIVRRWPRPTARRPPSGRPASRSMGRDGGISGRGPEQARVQYAAAEGGIRRHHALEFPAGSAQRLLSGPGGGRPEMS